MPFGNDLLARLSGLEFRETVRDHRYLASYGPTLTFFRSRVAVPEVNADDAKIGVILVYSWMGRAEFDPECWGNFQQFRLALSRCLANDATPEQVAGVQSFVGGSLIATSKFLHFSRPDSYAMWDQHVARAAYGYQYWSQFNRVDRYTSYLADLRALEVPAAVLMRVRQIIGETTDLRAKEFALFQLGIREQPASMRNDEMSSARP